MGVRTLVGEADGTTRAAAMYCSSSGWMIGPIFEAEDAPEQIAAFLEWLRGVGRIDHRSTIFGTDDHAAIHRRFRVPIAGDGDDPRDWTDEGLQKLVTYWRFMFVVDGRLREPDEADEAEVAL